MGGGGGGKKECRVQHTSSLFDISFPPSCSSGGEALCLASAGKVVDKWWSYCPVGWMGEYFSLGMSASEFLIHSGAANAVRHRLRVQ